MRVQLDDFMSPTIVVEPSLAIDWSYAQRVVHVEGLDKVVYRRIGSNVYGLRLPWSR